jgi:hypothetical protein
MVTLQWYQSQWFDEGFDWLFVLNVPDKSGQSVCVVEYNGGKQRCKCMGEESFSLRESIKN